MGENKRKHHTLPERYLRGFAEPDTSFIWVFRRETPYQPGHKKGRDNPYRDGVRVTSAVRDRHAVRRATDGSVDFNTYENEFEKLEKKVECVWPLLEKKQPIQDEHKQLFAEYMSHFIRRTDSRMNDVKKLIKSETNLFPWDQVVLNHAENGRFAEAIAISKDESYYRSEDGQKLISLKSAIEPYRQLEQELLARKWEFAVATTDAAAGMFFLTSDNPVFYNRHLGVRGDAVMFPLRRDLCLVISPVLATKSKGDLAYISYPDEMIRMLNAMTIQFATKEVYSSSSDKWVWDVLNSGYKEC